MGRQTSLILSPASFLGVDLAPLYSRHFLWSLRHQDDQLESHQTVPHRNSVVLLATDPGRYGRPLLRLLRVLDRGPLRQRGGVAGFPLLRPLVRLLLRCPAGAPLRDLLRQLPDAGLVACRRQEASVKKKNPLLGI